MRMACREGAEEGRGHLHSAETDLRRMTMMKKAYPNLCWASVGGASLCCVSVKPSDWLVEVEAGRLIGG